MVNGSSTIAQITFQIKVLYSLKFTTWWLKMRDMLLRPRSVCSFGYTWCDRLALAPGSWSTCPRCVMNAIVREIVNYLSYLESWVYGCQCRGTLESQVTLKRLGQLGRVSLLMVRPSTGKSWKSGCWHRRPTCLYPYKSHLSRRVEEEKNLSTSRRISYSRCYSSGHCVTSTGVSEISMIESFYAQLHIVVVSCPERDSLIVLWFQCNHWHWHWWLCVMCWSLRLEIRGWMLLNPHWFCEKS